MASTTGAAREDSQKSVSDERFPWLSIAWFGALLLMCYAPVLLRMVRQWANDPDMGHGFFVPAVAAYIAWQKRDLIQFKAPSPSWWGLLIVAYGAVQLYVATLGAELFLARTAFLISLAGVVWLLGGFRYLRIVGFPRFLLCFMVPIPAIIYSQITFPLQLIASRVAETSLTLFGIPVLREGNILELPRQSLSVVEACSGIRSLLSLAFLSLVYGYFFDKRNWMRAVLLAATVPIAVAANASRVTLTGLLGEYNPELAEGFFHGASGWVIFMVALAILIVFHQLMALTYRGIHARR
jgi:exosortase